MLKKTNCKVHKIYEWLPIGCQGKFIYCLSVVFKGFIEVMAPDAGAE